MWNDNGYGLSVIGKLKETKVKRNLYYEIKDKILEETVDHNKIVRKTRKTKVYGLHSTKDVRDNLIELLNERMRHHKDKFISPTLYQELRGLEIKKNGKCEHSDLTHDDQIFSYLMAMYVWYEGKNLRENFGIQKMGIKTEDSVDDIVELEGAEDVGDITEQITYLTKEGNDKFEMQLGEMQKAKGLLFSEFVNKQRAEEEERLKALLQNPAIKKAYADQYGVDPETITTQDGVFGMQEQLPSSLFLDFNKPQEELSQNSIYTMIPNITSINQYPQEDESQQ